MAAADYKPLVQQIYISYFGRPADTVGLDNFSKMLDGLKAPLDPKGLSDAYKGSTPLKAVIDSFGTSPESIALYGTDDMAFVTSIYQNMLNREPDFDGLLFWYNAVHTGGLSKGNAALSIMSGAYTNVSDQGKLDAAVLANKVTIAGNFTAGVDTGPELAAYRGDAAAATARDMLKAVTATTVPATFQATVDSTLANIVAASIPVVNASLTTGLDTLLGKGGNDVFTAVLGNVDPTQDTLNALDSIDGGAGNDTLTINDVNVTGTTLPSGLTVSSIENVVMRGAGAVNINTSTWTGVNSLKVTQATGATATAAATTAIQVTGATGAVVVEGGASQSVTTSGSTIAMGATTVTAGAISATHTAQAGSLIAIDGGSTVTVNATGGTTGGINVGQGGVASDLATGAVVVNATGAASVAATSVLHGNIQVKGGSSVVVNAKATSSDAAAKTDTTVGGSTTTEGNVSVTGGAATTSVTVNQTAAVGPVAAVVAIAGIKEVQTVTFNAMAANDTLVINGLTFTAAKALTAAQVATAFANLAASATQGNAPAANGIYSGTSTTLGFTSGAVTTTSTTSTVTFTGTTNANLAPLTIGGTAGVATVANVTDGGASTSAKTGVLGVAAGTVAVDGNITGADVLATVSLDGYGATSTVKSDALTSLSLANSDSGVTVTNGTATTLALSLNNLGAVATAAVGLGPTYTTLNVTTTGVESYAAITAAGVQALNVAGSVALDLSGSALVALKTVKVTGSAGLTIDASGANVTSVDAAGTSGDNAILIDATNATYVGGTGKDSVTLLNTGSAKAVTLGAGNDTLTLSAGTVSLTAIMDGGTGSDTLAMDAADAATASATTTFATKIDGFEKLSLGAVATTLTKTVDMANMDNINYVVTAGGAATSELVLTHFAANGSVEMNGAAVTTTVTLNDATGTTDVLNILTNVDALDVGFGTVAAAGVETINLTATDLDPSTSTGSGVKTATLTLSDAALKSVVVTGNSHVTLINGANVVALTSLDGSAMTGKLTASTNGTVAETIKGGAGADVLTALGNADVLIGGAGNDKLIVGLGADRADLTTLTGGAGNDTFDISVATTNVNSYATITDLTAGDKIQFAASGASFKASKVSLSDTAVFQDYANAAIASTVTGEISWFQYLGNTYVIEHASGVSPSFVNGSDVIVKITGAVDLSTASYSASADILLIA